MPQPHVIALGVALVIVVGFVVSLGLGSLLVGAIDFLFARPKFSLLKTSKGINGMAFHFKWNAAKQPGKMDTFKIRVFNPFSEPTQVELAAKFEPQEGEVIADVDFGPGMNKVRQAFDSQKALVHVEVFSETSGLCFGFDFKGNQFMALLDEAKETVEGVVEGNKKAANTDALTWGAPPEFNFGLKPRDMVAGPVEGEAVQIALPTNPAFTAYFSGGESAGGGGDAGATQENFAVSKVWIAPGCIVCDACETIYPEVFDVQADTCVIKPDAPLTDGLRIEEAADACPVEVIKFERA